MDGFSHSDQQDGEAIDESTESDSSPTRPPSLNTVTPAPSSLPSSPPVQTNHERLVIHIFPGFHIKTPPKFGSKS